MASLFAPMRWLVTCTIFCTGMAVGANAWAQSAADDPDRKESDAPPPPSFDILRLVPFDVSANSALKWGFDPAAMKITKDGIVRYVVVAQSPSGVLNAMYEGVRCTTSEWKTYARFHKDSGWTAATDVEWKPLFGQPSKHALRLAQQGMCTGNAPALTVNEVVRSVKNGDLSK